MDLNAELAELIASRAAEDDATSALVAAKTRHDTARATFASAVQAILDADSAPIAAPVAAPVPIAPVVPVDPPLEMPPVA